MTTDLGVNEKSRSALFYEEGEVFGGFAASSQDLPASPRSPASPGEGTHGNILASASSGEINPGEKCKGKAVAGLPKSHQMQLQSQHTVKSSQQSFQEKLLCNPQPPSLEGWWPQAMDVSMCKEF